MRKTVLFFLLSFIILTAQAQKGTTISGVIVSADDNRPLEKVVVSEKGARNTQLSDENGNYSITLQTSNATLSFSFVGYSVQDIKVGNASTINVFLAPQQSSLDSVVVTALGIRRELKSLGYASQEVTSEQLSQSRQSNLLNALQGKVVGATISSTGGGPGQGTSILIRGINSLDPGQSSQPLFVIDGLPIDNTTSTYGTTGGRGVQMSNRISDINPNDIESVNILRGGAATALYGLRGANGVVVITTKSGRAGQLRVNLTSSYSIDQVNKYPDVQLKYTQGYLGVYDSTSFWPAWGPTVEEARKIDPTHPEKLENNWKRAYNTGHSYRNSVNFSGGTEVANFNASMGYNRQDGLIPFTYYQDVSSKISGQLKFSEKFKMNSSIYYTNSVGNFYDADRYNEELAYWAPRWDIRDYVKPDGTEKTYGNGNAIYIASTNKFKSNVDHVIGTINFAYSPVNWFTASYMLGMDTYSDARTATAPGPRGVPDEFIEEDNGLGFVHEYRINFRQVNSNLLLTFDKTWNNKFQTTLRIGNDVLDRTRNYVAAEGDELDVWNLFNLSNAKVVSISQFKQNYRILGLYGDLTFGYNNYLFLNLTGRNDWTSTLAKNNRSFFYPSASLSYVFSQHLSMPSWLNYGKLRASLAGIGKDAEPYKTSIVYTPSFDAPINGVIGWTRNGSAGLQTLTPESTVGFEVGTDLGFLKDRFGLNFTWYKNNSRDQIIPVSVSQTTGFTDITLNAGEIENKGVEITLRGKPVVSKDFKWDVSVNYSSNRNKILSIYPGLSEIVIGSQFGYSNSTVTMKYVPGKSVGDIYGTPWSRYQDTKDPYYSDPNQPILIGANGFPVLTSRTTQRILGNSYPKWQGSIGNNFSYKNFNLYFLWETRQGLQKYNQFANFMAAFGESAITLNREDMVVFDGVLADGTPNTKEVYLGQGVGPDGVDYGAGYYRNVYRGISEVFVQDASWVRLRTATLSYNLPPEWFKSSFVKNMSVSVTGNNLLLFTDYEGFDPESSSSPAGSTANGFAGFTYPALRSYILTLNIGF